MTKFTLEILLGNDAMQTPEDIAVKLREVADRVENASFQFAEGDSEPLQYIVRDDNGNQVGIYWVRP